MPPISTSCCRARRTCPMGASLRGSRACYLPILDWHFDGPRRPTPSSTRSSSTGNTTAFADFPLYPINGIAPLNALLGTFYVHPNLHDDSLAAPIRRSSPAYQGNHGGTNYYFFETETCRCSVRCAPSGCPSR